LTANPTREWTVSTSQVPVGIPISVVVAVVIESPHFRRADRGT
jgi:hypothetical protein